FPNSSSSRVTRASSTRANHRIYARSDASSGCDTSWKAVFGGREIGFASSRSLSTPARPLTDGRSAMTANLKTCSPFRTKLRECLSQSPWNIETGPKLSVRSQTRLRLGKHLTISCEPQTFTHRIYHHGRRKNCTKARQLFERSISFDPNFARAYAEL